MAENVTNRFLDFAGLGIVVNNVKSADAKVKAETIDASKITIDTSTTTEGYAKSYSIKQNGMSIATIDIPKDMFVSSGKVVTNPEGHTEGTYIELTLANVTNDKIYINVGALVDIYVPEADATQVQLAIDASTREISATIIAGSIGNNELADRAVDAFKLAENAVLTNNIHNGAVSTDKLFDNCVTTEKIAFIAVTEDKIDKGAVTGVKIADGAISKTKLNSALSALIDKISSIEPITADEINSLFTTK